MAFQEKVLRLSHQQLNDLAKKYERNNPDVNIAQSEQGKRFEKSRRNKRPEREIYRPGHRIRSRLSSETAEDGEESKDEQLQNVGISEWREDSTEYNVHEVQGRLQDLDLGSDFGLSPDNHAQNYGDRQNKRRQKRPDIQIYRPRLVQLNTEDTFVDEQPSGLAVLPHTMIAKSPTMERKEIEIKKSSQVSWKNKDVNHMGHDTRDQNGMAHTHEAEDIARFSRPPRQAPRYQRGGHKGTGQFQKASSLDWDDQPSHNTESVVDAGHVIDHGWGTDCMHDESVYDHNESSRDKKKWREQRSSGQKQWNNRRGSLPKSHTEDTSEDKFLQQPYTSRSKDAVPSSSKSLPTTTTAGQPPKITSDEKVEQSINKGTFQGLVFTNSNISDKSSDANRTTNEVPHPNKARPGRSLDNDRHEGEQRWKSNENEDKEKKVGPNKQLPEEKLQNKQQEELQTNLACINADADNKLTWGEQVEEAEKIQAKVDEQQRIAVVTHEPAIVTHEHEQITSGTSKEPTKCRGGWRDGDRNSELHVDESSRRDRQHKNRDRQGNDRDRQHGQGNDRDRQHGQGNDRDRQHGQGNDRDRQHGQGNDRDRQHGQGNDRDRQHGQGNDRDRQHGQGNDRDRQHGQGNDRDRQHGQGNDRDRQHGQGNDRDRQHGQGNDRDRQHGQGNDRDRQHGQGNDRDRQHGQGNDRDRQHGQGNDRDRQHGQGNDRDRQHGQGNDRDRQHGQGNDRNRQHGQGNDRDRQHGQGNDGDRQHGQGNDRDRQHGQGNDRDRQHGQGNDRDRQHGQGNDRDRQHGQGNDRNRQHGQGNDRNRQHGQGNDRNRQHGQGNDQDRKHGQGNERDRQHGQGNEQVRQHGQGNEQVRQHSQEQDWDRQHRQANDWEQQQGHRNEKDQQDNDLDNNHQKFDVKKHSEDMPKKNLHLKVTFASGNEQRKVMVSTADNRLSEERNLRIPVRTKSPNETCRPGRGGLIKLPTATEPSTQHPVPPSRHPALQQHHQQRGGLIQHRGRGRAQSRGSSHRTLYDPKNPGKSTQASSSPTGLHFYDPADPHQNSPPTHQVPFFADQFYQSGEYQGPPQNYYDYSYPAGAPRAPFYGVPPGAHRMPHPGPQHPGPPPTHLMQQLYDRGVAMRADDYNRDPYGRSGFEQEVLGAQIPAGNRSRAESLLNEILPLDVQLTNLVARGTCQEDSLAMIQKLRKDIESRFEEVILLDPEVCNNQNLDQLLWKCVHYQVIEMLRKHLADRDDEQLKDFVLKLLDDGIAFYENLLKNLQTTYKFSLDSFLDQNVPAPDTLCRTTKLALYSAQKSMIFLGDIARYKEQVNQTASYGKARSWYMKAQQIAPKNGRPYNQLAILALYTRRKLDAVYYYMRSLAASNPFLTARESLMSLFDEARKRAEVSEKKRIQDLADRKQQRKPQQTPSRRKSYGQRIEVWVSVDGSTCQDEITGDETWDDLRKISAVELNKRFILSFLNVHGKLFTKIGMETFPEVSSQMLHEFKALLSHSPSPIGNSRLLQLVTINMFAIENAAPKDNSTMEENCRSLHQEYAVQLSLDMFGLLAERCTQLLLVHLQSGDCQILSNDLHCLFPSVKVCADWMTCHADDWNPPPVPRDPDLGPTIDVWHALAGLCNILNEVLISHVKLYPCKKEGCDPIVLPEDTMLAGFIPLLSLPQVTMYVHCTVDKDISRDCLRVDKMSLFGDYLCGIEPPLLSYDVSTRQYISIAPESTVTESESELNRSEVDEDVIIESDSEEEKIEHNTSYGSSGDESQIKALRARKVELEKKMAEKEKQQQNIRAVLDDTELHHHMIEIEVRPLMLIPDTNCFIDHLNSIKRLLATKRYTIVVPLIVINELDGLAKGSREGQYDTLEHAEMVYSGAQNTIQFLETEFENRNSHLRALTSKGTVMDTIAYRAETTTDEGNNDDLILSCCLHYCQDKARDYMPKASNEPMKLHREVVLLTDDRNLRLKAHTRNVPVKDLPSFIRWAKIS